MCYNVTNSIESISVVTVNDYSNSYPAGSDMSDLFLARLPNKSIEPYISIDDGISVLNASKSESH